jgi:hypothetical protein
MHCTFFPALAVAWQRNICRPFRAIEDDDDTVSVSLMVLEEFGHPKRSWWRVWRPPKCLSAGNECREKHQVRS